jgi:hypothetical protein
MVVPIAVADWERLLHPSAREPELVEVPSSHYLMVDGTGDPSTAAAFQEALQALYGVAYTLKFGLRKQIGREFRVRPPEALFWDAAAAGPDPQAALSNKEGWQWTLMIGLPDFVTADQVAAAVATLRRKHKSAALELLRFAEFGEGACAQVLHVGPYAAEAPTIALLHAFVRERGLHPRGRHHEIYLSDPRHTRPERLRTIIRQPVTAPQRN